jgi:cation:H+ antiporter
MQWILILTSLLLLFAGGDFLVKGTVGLSNKLKICKIVVSTIIAGFATSMPELVVCLKAAYNGTTDLVIGNIVGSNVANTLLILGFGWVLYPKMPNFLKLKKDAISQILIVIAFVLITFFGEINVYTASVLFSLITIYLFISYKMIKRNDSDIDLSEIDEYLEVSPTYKIPIIYIISGIAFLVVGANLLVNNAVSIARYYNISESVIGLTLIAVGTSIPELATTIVASIRRESSMIIGNVIGSNIFNIAAVLGITGIIFPLNISQNIVLIDRWILLFSTILLSLVIMFVKNRNTIRISGFCFISLYFIYVAFLFV